MTFIGGQSIFDFRLLTDKVGILTRNCMSKSFEGKIYFMWGAGFFVTDGTQVIDLSENKVRRTFVASLADDAAGSFVAVNPLSREVWYVPVTGSGQQSRAYVFDIDNGTWGIRDFSAVAYATSGINSVAFDDSWDTGPNTDWDTGGDISWRERSASPQQQLMAWIDPDSTNMNWADLNIDTRTATLTREAIKDDSDLVGTVTRVWIDGEVPQNGLTVSLSSRYADGDNYGSPVTGLLLPSDRWLSLIAKGRDFRVQVSNTGPDLWSLSRVGLDLAESGGQF